ncbi:hypothetical protein [Saccharicrinis sp. GN24d3]|uniref:hypothetical protein n=1 Tax=Saccharicrinis sp. GN24d3 TaxID=3458416 RepID=UPI004035CB25
MNFKIFIFRVTVLMVVFFLFDFLLSLFLVKGLDKYYGFGSTPEIMINGSSMAQTGFNRKDMEDLTHTNVSKYTYEGVSIVERKAMIEHFFNKYPKGVKTVIYELSPVMFSTIKEAENVYTLFYPYMDDKNIDSYIRDNAEPREYYVHKLIRTKRFESRLVVSIVNAYVGNYENFKTNQIDSSSVAHLLDEKGTKEVAMDESMIAIFESTMELVRAHSSNVILVMMPIYKAKLETFKKEGYDNMCDYFINYSSKYDKVRFLDLNKERIIQEPGYFSDPLHFNLYGQKYISDTVSWYL